MVGFLGLASNQPFGWGWMSIAILALVGVALALVLLIVLTRPRPGSSERHQDVGYGGDGGRNAGDAPRPDPGDSSYDGAPCDPSEPLDPYDYSPRENRQLLLAAALAPVIAAVVLMGATQVLAWCGPLFGPTHGAGLTWNWGELLSREMLALVHPLIHYFVLLITIDFISVFKGDIPEWDRKEATRNAVAINSVHVATVSLALVGFGAFVFEDVVVRGVWGRDFDVLAWLLVFLSSPLIVIAATIAIVSFWRSAFAPFQHGRKLTWPADSVFFDLIVAITIFVAVSTMVMYGADPPWRSSLPVPILLGLNTIFAIGAVLYLNRRFGRRQGNGFARGWRRDELVQHSVGRQVTVYLFAVVAIAGLVLAVWLVMPRDCTGNGEATCELTYDHGHPVCVSKDDAPQQVCMAPSSVDHCGRPLDPVGCVTDHDPHRRCQLVYEDCKPTCVPAKPSIGGSSRDQHRTHPHEPVCPPGHAPPPACALP